MDTQKIRDLIDKVIGKDGPLRVPAYWMHKLLKDTVDWAGEKFGKLDTKVEELETNLNTTSTGLSELTKEFEEYSAPKTYKTAKVVLSWSDFFYSTSGVVSGYRCSIENINDLFVNGESKIDVYVDIYAKCADGSEYLLIKDSNLRTVCAPIPAPAIGFSGTPAHFDLNKSFYAIHAPTGLPVLYNFTSRMSVVNPYPQGIYCGFAYTTTDICFTSQYPEHNIFETKRFYPQYDLAPPIIQKGMNYGRCTYVDEKDVYAGIFNFNTSVLTLTKDGNAYTATYNQSTGVVGELVQSTQSESSLLMYPDHSVPPLQDMILDRWYLGRDENGMMQYISAWHDGHETQLSSFLADNINPVIRLNVVYDPDAQDYIYKLTETSEELFLKYITTWDQFGEGSLWDGYLHPITVVIEDKTGIRHSEIRGFGRSVRTADSSAAYDFDIFGFDEYGKHPEVVNINIYAYSWDNRAPQVSVHRNVLSQAVVLDPYCRWDSDLQQNMILPQYRDDFYNNFVFIFDNIVYILESENWDNCLIAKSNLIQNPESGEWEYHSLKIDWSTWVVTTELHTVKIESSNVYVFSNSDWNGESDYQKLNEAYKAGKAIVCDGVVMVPVGGSDLVELNGSFTMPFGDGTQTISVIISFNPDYSLKIESKITTLKTEGDGTKFLSDDGTYKFVETNPFEIPSEGVLPETGKVGKIYLIPATTTGTDNLMYEYIWANDAWEKLGEFKADVDLSGYYNKSEVDAKTSSLNSKITSIDTNLKQQISDLNDSKLDVETASETLATKDEVVRKQNTLVSGVNIKTINKESLLGSGDIVIDTSVLNSTGVSQTKAMSQKATTDVLNEEITRATTKENELEGRIFAHESITQDAYDTAEYAETLAIDSNERSQNAETTASAAMNAVRTLEGLSNTDVAQTTLANTVAQIEQNSSDIRVLQEMFVLITEEAYEALEVKDPTKIYLMYEE